MAKIMSVDYKAIPGKANKIRNSGVQLNTEITNAYNSIREMHSSWYGERYNELVEIFNKMTDDINKILTLVISNIPYTLETVANNYSQADNGANVTTAKKEAPKKIANINPSKDVGMKFITENVEATQKKVSANFKKAISRMDEIGKTYAEINWNSEAADDFKTKFNSLKKNIINSFNEINQEFTKLMNQDKNKIQNAEKANRV